MPITKGHRAIIHCEVVKKKKERKDQEQNRTEKKRERKEEEMKQHPTVQNLCSVAWPKGECQRLKSVSLESSCHQELWEQKQGQFGSVKTG